MIDKLSAYLTGSKPTPWLKAEAQVKEKLQLLFEHNHFHWPESSYDAPIHVHHRTFESQLLWAMNKITDVHLYTIDTESDKPTHQHRHSIPSLIQVQVIHRENCFTVFLIEIQYLPRRSASLFLLIWHWFLIIFSPFLSLVLGDLFVLGISPSLRFFSLLFLLFAFVFHLSCERRYDCSISFSGRRSRCPAQSFSAGRGRC